MTKKVELGFKRIDKSVKLPHKAHESDAGYDIYSNEDVVLRYGEVITLSTGIFAKIPEGYYLRLKARSGIDVKTGIRVREGTIDQGYQNEIKVIIEHYDKLKLADKFFEDLMLNENQKNLSTINMDQYMNKYFDYLKNQKDTMQVIKKGDKIAQLILAEVIPAEIVEFNEYDNMSDRGMGGFGSTGM